MKGGKTSVKAVSSQYLSSILMSCPVGEKDTEIDVPVLNEKPYVRMTLDWLDRLGLKVGYSANLDKFNIPGGQRITSFQRRIPGDFSSATFLLAAGALAGGKLVLKGLDMNDPQGDKEIVDILRRMGAKIDETGEGIEVSGSRLRGMEIDLNSIPDAVPMLAVVGCFADGETILHNVPQARIKETDRLAVMASELSKLGATIRELPDGLVIKGGGLEGGRVNGHGDHRVVMALTIAGLAADKPVSVDTAEAAGVTFPGFWDMMSCLGAKIEFEDSNASQ
jgi:3-phosphoshikimate 1-carboxyvinyltransferase